MGVISRGLKNAFRNSIRTISIAVILAVSIGMTLVMLVAYKTVQGKITSVKSSIGNYITISPAGIRGFEGGGTLLTQDSANSIANLPHVSAITLTLSDRLTNSESTNNFPGESSSTNNKTNLTSPINPGSFGNRARQTQGDTSENQSGTFTMPINVTGTNDLSNAALNVSQFDLTSGDKIDPASSDNVAMIGKDLADKNSLLIGSTFQAYSQDIKVVGIYDSGNSFTNGSIVMPIKTLQNLSGQTDKINSIIVQTDSIDTVSSVQAAIKDKLGSSVDVVSGQDRSSQAISPLENIKTISLYSLIGSLVAGAVIIFLIMVMIVRERRREIGVLKAIGASNIVVVSQFVVESLTLTFLSSVLGIILGLVLSNPVLNVLINNSSSSSSQGENLQRGPGFGPAAVRIGAGITGGAQNAWRDLHAAVGTEIILYGIAAAVIIAIVGSAIPAYLIAKVRPAEVLRSE